MTRKQIPSSCDDALATLRCEMAALDTPAAVEQALLAAFASHHAAPPWHRRLARALMPRWLAPAGGLAAAVLAAVVVLLPADGPDTGGGLPAMAANDAFIALQPADRIARETAPRLVETEVPRIALVALGVAVTPENANQAVRAEMLVAADGEPLALRLPTLN